MGAPAGAVSGLLHLPNVDVERRFRAEKALAELAIAQMTSGTNAKVGG
jgi:hypothetical protein